MKIHVRSIFALLFTSAVYSASAQIKTDPIGHAQCHYFARDYIADTACDGFPTSAEIILACGNGGSCLETAAEKTAPENLCVVAVIWKDGIVTVDTDCMEKYAARWSPDNTDAGVAWSYILKSVKTGKAILP